MKKRKARTADELMAELEADPEWVADRARRDAEFEKRQAELDRAEAPLVAELRAAGHDVESAWLLTPPYPKAVPILLGHFKRAYPEPIREGIARALGVREALPSWSALERWYTEEPQPRAKDGLANALCELAIMSGGAHLDDVIELVRDRRNGESRLLLLRALENSKEPRAWATLMAMGDDPDLVLEIRHILNKRERKRRGLRPPRTNE